MRHWAPPSALSHQGIMGLRGVGAVPAVPSPPSPSPATTVKTAAAGTAPSPGYKAKPLKRSDTYVSRDENEVKACEDDPANPGRARTCRIVDDAVLRLTKTGIDGVDTMMRASEDSTRLAPERNIAFAPYNIYGASSGSMIDHYAAMYAIREYQRTEAANDDVKKPVPIEELTAMLERRTADADLLFYSKATLKDAITDSFARQVERATQARAIAAGKDESQARIEAEAAATKAKTDADIKLKQEEKAQLQKTADTTRTVVMVAGGAVALAAIVFVMRKR